MSNNTEFTTTNPFTNRDLKTYNYHSEKEVLNVIESAHKRWLTYRDTSYEDRAIMLRKAADILEGNKAKYAEMMTLEMGKLINSSIAEVEKCAWVCRYYADNGAEFLGDELVETDASKSYITYNSIGVVLAVMPWNYPFWQVFRFAAPALMAGNTALLKHASNVPGSALFIEEVLRLAGFPEHCFTSLLIESGGVKSILDHKHVKAATLTGSEPAGSAVAAQAGGNIKHTVLELGGSDPYLILEDADIELAVEQCTTSRLLNTGQSCIGAKRFIVVESVYDTFLSAFHQKMSSATMGDPMTDVDVGPMARHDLRDEVHDQVVESVTRGATLICGGTIPKHEGAFYPPTILTDLSPGMPAYEDEIFGPVASVIKAKNEQDAIRIANDSKFGLGACVFSEDVKRAEMIARDKLEAGCCFVNQYVKSDPRLPFGGIKTSGYGRELSYHGIRAFTNIKTVYIK